MSTAATRWPCCSCRNSNLPHSPRCGANCRSGSFYTEALVFLRKHFTTKQESASIIAFFTESYANYADGIPGVWETVPAYATVIPCLAETLSPLPVTACSAWRNAGSRFAAGGWFCAAHKPYRCIFVCLFLVYIRCSPCGSNGYFFIQKPENNQNER